MALTLRSRWSQRRNRSTAHHPRQPYHKRAIHSSPERSPADNHGQPRSSLDLGRSPYPQVTAASDLAFKPARIELHDSAFSGGVEVTLSGR
jgi:hypothetical protein